MLRAYFNDALLELYKFYAAESQNEEQNTSIGTVQAKDFDELGGQTARARNVRRSSVMYVRLSRWEPFARLRACEFRMDS